MKRALYLVLKNGTLEFNVLEGLKNEGFNATLVSTESLKHAIDDFPEDHHFYNLRHFEQKENQESILGLFIAEAEKIEVTIAVERREGNEIRLYAENLSEEAGEKYSYQWQYSLNNEEWFAVEGATGKDYTFRLDQTNGRYYWRLIVSEKE